MSQPSFKDILSQAKERFASGEPLGSILADYPEYADELRTLLHEDQHRVRDLLNEGKAKPKNQPARSRRSPVAIVLTLTALLAIAALLGFFGIYATVQVDPLPGQVIAQGQPYANDACASLAYEPRPIVEQQQLNTNYSGDTAVDDDYAADVEELEYAEESPLPTASADGTRTGGIADTGEPVPPIGGESMVVDESETLPDTGGGGGAEIGASAPEAEADLAVEYPEGEEIVPTSVASFEERPEDVVAESRSDSAEGLALEPIERRDPTQPLQAGEIDDNADWDTYQEYRRNYLEQYGEYTVLDLDTTDRQVIRVVDGSNLPVLGACVQVFHGERLITESFTYATGLTMFFPNLSDDTRYVDEFTVRATYGQTVAESELDRTDIGGALNLELPLERDNTRPRLDVMFLIDSTGSMSDEIAQLQDNILAISTQINALPGDIDVRYGLVTYRDRTDAYVTRVFDFTDDVRVFQSNLNTVVAGGGGDYPESLNQGLDEALNVVSWRGADTIKLVFLVADAPPQLGYADDVDYTLSMQEALGRGIKVHPIASSGLEPEGEYILRQIGQYTMGHFIFLTYEGGVPGTPGEDRPDLEVGTPEDEQGVGDYSVAELDDLVLRLITDEIAAFRGE